MKSYIKQNKILFITTILVSVISSLGYVFMAILLQQLLDIAVGKDIQQFIRTVLFSIFYFAVLGIFLYLQSLLSKKVICKIMCQIRSDVFQGTVHHSIEDFNKKNTADYISIITNDVKMIEDNFLLPLFEVVQYTVIFTASFLLMIYFDIIVTVCVIAAIAIMFLIPSFLGKSLEKRQKKYSSKLADFTVGLKDILSGFEIIKSYSMKRYVIQRFSKENEETIRSKYSVDRLLALNEGISSFLALMVQIVVLFLSAYFIITERITVGTLLGMVQVSSNLANPLVMIFTNVPKIKSIQPIAEKMQNISQYSLAHSQKEHISSFDFCVNTKDLGFSYDKHKEILNEINCTIEKGKKYAFVGKSGCGKSTLIKLIAGYYSDFKGNVQYDSDNLSTLDIDKITGLSSIIHQNVYMFDESIFDNICLHEDYSENELQSVLSESGLSSFIKQVPNGLKYRVGENGDNLSGGQKQRIAVARALIRKKPLLILDEGTSAIDMQTAYDIESRLLAISDLTLLTITHNMSKDILELYDEIVFMADGKIIEQGTFETLISRHTAFYDFYQLKK